MALRDLIQSVDEILPTLHESVRTEVPPSFIVLSLTLLHFPFKNVMLMQSDSFTRYSKMAENALRHPRVKTASTSPQIEGTEKLLNNDMAELISKMRLAQQNAITSLKEECKKQMLSAAHTLAMDSKNMLDAVDQARVRANIAKPADL